MLCRAFHGEGHEVVVLSRSPADTPWKTVPWDGAGAGSWVEAFEGADVVINLAGRSVDCRYGKRNRALIIGPNGRQRAVYDKVHLTSLDAQLFEPGRQLEVWRLGGVRLAAQICLDMRVPEAWRTLKQRRAQVVAHPSAAIGGAEWKVPVLEGVLRARASENGLFIVSANSAGPIQMVKSAIYDPHGLILAQANYGTEQLIDAELELEAVRNGFRPLDAPGLYSSLVAPATGGMDCNPDIGPG